MVAVLIYYKLDQNWCDACKKIVVPIYEIWLLLIYIFCFYHHHLSFNEYWPTEKTIPPGIIEVLPPATANQRKICQILHL